MMSAKPGYKKNDDYNDGDRGGGVGCIGSDTKKGMPEVFAFLRRLFVACHVCTLNISLKDN